MSFTKLVPQIVQSSIWNERPEIRCVWIAMLATKDENGYVRGDVQTISRLSNVKLEDAQEALDKFQSPDPSSHTPDNDGRRISSAPGGWIILNHELYRSRDDQYRAKTKERVRRWRMKSAQESDGNVTKNVTETHPSVSVSVSERESAEREGDSQVEKLAILLMKSIRSWKQDYIQLRAEKIEAWYDSTCSEIEKMLRIDKRSPATAERILKWIPGYVGRGGFTWSSNILSGATLRKQFDRLESDCSRTSGVAASASKAPFRIENVGGAK